MRPAVLIIDDDLFHVEVVRGALEDDGLEVLTAHDASSGVAAARRARPAAVILDFSLRGADGDAVLAQLRAARETQAIPVLFLSAHADVEQRVGPHRNVAFLRKENGLEPVRQAVRAALRRAALGWPWA